jgi:hypothetical protein
MRAKARRRPMADSPVLDQIAEWLAQRTATVPAVAAQAAEPLPSEVVEACADLQHRLSGAFGEAVEVGVGDGDEAGAYFAAVPAGLLVSSGLRMVEAAARARHEDGRCEAPPRLLVGTAEAVVNAERRVAKHLGEGWRASLDSYPVGTGSPDVVWFRIDRV